MLTGSGLYADIKWVRFVFKSYQCILYTLAIILKDMRNTTLTELLKSLNVRALYYQVYYNGLPNFNSF